jgi:hypothetical protein
MSETVQEKRPKQRNSGRRARGMEMWTFWLRVADRDRLRSMSTELAERVHRTPSGKLRKLESAMTRALVEEALQDPGLIDRAVLRVMEDERLTLLTTQQ